MGFRFVFPALKGRAKVTGRYATILFVTSVCDLEDRAKFNRRYATESFPSFPFPALKGRAKVIGRYATNEKSAQSVEYGR